MIGKRRGVNFTLFNQFLCLIYGKRSTSFCSVETGTFQQFCLFCPIWTVSACFGFLVCFVPRLSSTENFLVSIKWNWLLCCIMAENSVLIQYYCVIVYVQGCCMKIFICYFYLLLRICIIIPIHSTIVGLEKKRISTILWLNSLQSFKEQLYGDSRFYPWLRMEINIRSSCVSNAPSV